MRVPSTEPGVNAFEDRALEVTSMVDISAERQIAAVNAALKAVAA
ncbi:MAG: hypothetical protein RBS99_11630 [Rhodospirillales bacterium]|jgi:hypothetical protein|nr:hypothetical protein [Rhodospirillales bacterium]